jgi:hypothetical protein
MPQDAHLADLPPQEVPRVEGILPPPGYGDNFPAPRPLPPSSAGQPTRRKAPPQPLGPPPAPPRPPPSPQQPPRPPRRPHTHPLQGPATDYYFSGGSGVSSEPPPPQLDSITLPVQRERRPPSGSAQLPAPALPLPPLASAAQPTFPSHVAAPVPAQPTSPALVAAQPSPTSTSPNLPRASRPSPEPHALLGPTARHTATPWGLPGAAAPPRSASRPAGLSHPPAPPRGRASASKAPPPHALQNAPTRAPAFALAHAHAPAAAGGWPRLPGFVAPAPWGTGG